MIQEYEEMRKKFLQGEITEVEWCNFCTKLLFANPNFVEMCKRMKDR